MSGICYIVFSVVNESSEFVRTPLHVFTCEKKAEEVRQSLENHEEKKEECYREIEELDFPDFEEREQVLRKYGLEPHDMETMYFGDITFEVVPVCLD